MPCIRIALVLSLGLLSSQAAVGQTTSSNPLGIGTSGLPGTTSSIAGTTSSSSTSNSGSGAGTTGQTGTTGVSTTNPNPGFIGGNTATAFVGAAREASNQQTQNRQFQAFQSDQQNSTSQSSQTGTPRQVRTVLRIGFDFPQASALQQAGQMAEVNSPSLARFTSSKPELSAINVSITSDGVAVLTGTSPTTDASRLAANLIRLQPGVRKVSNEIAVAR